jgi:hypothetical protein
MKQQILNLKKKLLLVELPEGAKGVNISALGDIVFETNGTKEVEWLPDDGLVKKCYGKLTDITEEQFKEYVEQYMVDKWRNYLIESQYIEYLKPAAKESFFSYLEANGVYFKNNNRMPSATIWQTDQIMYNRMEKAWQEAEEKVWKPDNTYLFEII